MDVVMTIISAFSFAAALWATMNQVEYCVNRLVSPRMLNYICIVAWTVFAWTLGVFPS